VVEAKVSARIVEQRMRNGIIEYLTLASSFEQQRKYQRAVPAISVPNEVINQWEDCVPEPSLVGFGPPVFTSDELAAMIAFGIVWAQVAHDIPQQLPVLEETLTLPQWEQLCTAATVALNVFNRRGRLPEDSPI
jgi:hypothetical protein